MLLRVLALQLLIPACLVAGPLYTCVGYVPKDVQCPTDWDSECHGFKEWHRPTPAAFSQGRTQVPHVKLDCAAPPEFQASELEMDARAEMWAHLEEHLYFLTKFKRCLYWCLGKPCPGKPQVEHSEHTQSSKVE